MSSLRSAKLNAPLAPLRRQRLAIGDRVHVNEHGVRTVMYPVQYAGPIIGRSSLLPDLINEMADWDIASPDEARALRLQIIPGSSPVLVINYRTPPVLIRRFGPEVVRQPHRRNCATRLQSGLVIVQPEGAMGVIVVRLKAEAAANLLGERMLEFLNVQIGLDDLFPASELSRLEERLANAATGAERFAYVENFFHAHRHTRPAEPITARAAALLRRNPQLRVGQLAAQIDISERQLLRRFSAMFGVSPKQFARIARIERVMAARARGADWVDVAYELGFNDQAHMINEFTEIVGVSPAKLVRSGTSVGGGISHSSTEPG